MPASEPPASALIRSERAPFELAESPWPAVEQIARQLLARLVGELNAAMDRLLEQPAVRPERLS